MQDYLEELLDTQYDEIDLDEDFIDDYYDC